MPPDLIDFVLAFLPHLRYWRPLLLDYLSNNGPRVYAVAAAVIALVAFYVPALPVALVLAVVAALLGVGEKVNRANVPASKVVVTEDDLASGEEVVAHRDRRITQRFARPGD